MLPRSQFLPTRIDRPLFRRDAKNILTKLRLSKCNHSPLNPFVPSGFFHFGKCINPFNISGAGWGLCVYVCVCWGGGGGVQYFVHQCSSTANTGDLIRRRVLHCLPKSILWALSLNRKEKYLCFHSNLILVYFLNINF